VSFAERLILEPQRENSGETGYERYDYQALKPLIRKTQPYSKKIAHRGIWVEPELLAEIEYRAKSVAGKVRVWSKN